MAVASATTWDCIEGSRASSSELSQTRAGLPDISDEHLMAAYQQGDGRSFERLYARHRAPLYRFLHRMTAPSDADEIFQEVWLAVIKGKARYVPTARFTTFLFSIAHNRVADRFRRTGRRFLVDDSEEKDNVPDGEPGPLEIALNGELADALRHALAQLPLEQREAFLMQAEGDLSLEEIAEASGVSRETVKSRLRYAHRRLRQSLESWK